MKLPRYFIVGERPVQFVATADGGMDVQALNWSTGPFVRDMSYLTRCSLGDAEVNEVDEKTFAEQLALIRERLR